MSCHARSATDQLRRKGNSSCPHTTHVGLSSAASAHHSRVHRTHACERRPAVEEWHGHGNGGAKSSMRKRRTLITTTQTTAHAQCKYRAEFSGGARQCKLYTQEKSSYNQQGETCQTWQRSTLQCVATPLPRHQNQETKQVQQHGWRAKVPYASVRTATRKPPKPRCLLAVPRPARALHGAPTRVLVCHACMAESHTCAGYLPNERHSVRNPCMLAGRLTATRA